MKCANLCVKGLWMMSFACFACSCSMEEAPLDPGLVRKFSFTSAYTGTTYPVYVVLPEGYQSSGQYKTLYLLDGDDVGLPGQKVYESAGSLNHSAAARHQVPGALVVAIGATEDRIRDYSPTAINMFKGQGGGVENYARFLEIELIPRIEKEFGADTSSLGRTIAGHSLGGSAGGYLFTHHPSVFSKYLLLSPAFWWDEGIQMRYEEETRAGNVYRHTLVYVGCGEFEEGIAILAEEWYRRMRQFYPNCITTFYKVQNAGHSSSAFDDFEKAIDFYYLNQ